MLRIMGRAEKAVEVTFVRPLGPADAALLAVEGRETGQPRPIQRLRDTHHGLARALASGMKHEEAAFVTGYSPSRISILLKDPTFIQLVEFYRANADLAFADLQERMAGLALDFAGELQDRLETSPETMSNGFVLEALKTLADRTGHAPVARSVNVNLDLGDRLAAARERAGLSGPRKEASPAIDLEPVT